MIELSSNLFPTTVPNMDSSSINKLVSKITNTINERQQRAFYSFWENYVLGKKEQRESLRKEGFVAPNSISLELTTECNRHCAHCAIPSEPDKRMFLDTAVELITYFKKRGTYGMVVYGGEPFILGARNVLFETAKIHNDLLFWVYTNGDFINEEVAFTLDSLKNIIPLLSVDGTENYNDSLRGEGSYESVKKAAGLLSERKLAKGYSINISQENNEEVFNQEFLVPLPSLEPCLL